MICNITTKLGYTSAVVETITGMELQRTIRHQKGKFTKVFGQELKLDNFTLQVSSKLLTHLLSIVALHHWRINTYMVSFDSRLHLPLVII